MAIWEKLFSKIAFKNYPDTSTPLNATNLNKMTDAIDGIDDRVVELNSNLNTTNSNLNTVSNKWVSNGIINRDIVRVQLPNNSSCLVSIHGGNGNSLLYMVWVYGNSVYKQLISGTENVDYAGSRYGVLPEEDNTLAICSQSHTSIYALFTLK